MATAEAETPDQYIDRLSDERKEPVIKLRKVIKKNLPKGFTETITYGMLSYVVPHSLYPKGYHVDSSLPLPFISVASQKNYIALYHMGLYADTALLKWFTEEYKKHSKTRLDMGKSCIRFKKPDDIPFDLIADLCSKITPEQWIDIYQKGVKK